LSKWQGLVPNIVLLNNALSQTGWKGNSVSEKNWKDLIYKKISEADWEKVRRDVKNFLENPSDREIFTQENVKGLIKPSDK
jgi:hypothetical protein